MRSYRVRPSDFARLELARLAAESEPSMIRVPSTSNPLEGPQADANARANALKAAAGEGPQVIPGPDSAPTVEDARAIIRRVAVQEFASQWEYDSESIRDHHPALNGIEDSEIDALIAEDLE